MLPMSVYVGHCADDSLPTTRPTSAADTDQPVSPDSKPGFWRPPAAALGRLSAKERDATTSIRIARLSILNQRFLDPSEVPRRWLFAIVAAPLSVIQKAALLAGSVNPRRIESPLRWHASVAIGDALIVEQRL